MQSQNKPKKWAGTTEGLNANVAGKPLKTHATLYKEKNQEGPTLWV